MKEADWNDCLFSGIARKVSQDTARAKSLSEISNERIMIIPVITVKNCNFVFEDYYTSIMELLQAIIFLNGFNVSNHIGLGFYLRDILCRDDLYRIFDDLRFKRNSLTYYGNRRDFPTANEAVKNCKLLIKELKKLLSF